MSENDGDERTRAAAPARGGAATAPLKVVRPAAPKPAAPPRPAAPPAPAATPPEPGMGRVRRFAQPARAKARHWGVIATFALCVLAPLAVLGWYLAFRTTDQYASTVGFSVRKEESHSALDIFGGLASLSGSSATKDSDILYKFILSQELVSRLNDELGLVAKFSEPYDGDPLFAFDKSGSVEDLVRYWHRMVRVNYDTGTGLIEVRVTAFKPEDAQAISAAIFKESSVMINKLSAIARSDVTRYAQEDLDNAIERQKASRQALTAFRLRTLMVDPQADLEAQMALLNTLNGQLAESVIQLDLLKEVAQPNDPRIKQADRKIGVIQDRIDEERRKFGVGGQGPGGEDYATVVSEFERLKVDEQFAETAYVTAQASYNTAVADANRQSRYLAAYIEPTLAEAAEYPRRWVILGLAGLFAFLLWSIGVLVYYSVRDRR